MTTIIGSPTSPECAERHGTAMGSTYHVVALGDPSIRAEIVEWAVGRIEDLEARWSRFRPSSEISQINSSPGAPIPVSPETVELVQRAVEARALSGGRFDPTMLQAALDNGYDRTFVLIRTPAGMSTLGSSVTGGGGVTVDPDANTVMVEAGTGIDPGGIGKGHAADLIAQEMVELGAAGALVNLGGDLRCSGDGPADGGWVVSVGDGVAGVPNRVVVVAEGAVATSTPARRRWSRRTTNGLAATHHLLDPATGQAARTPARAVTVIAARCADAEWLATSIAAEGMLPADPDIVGGATVIMTSADGETTVAGTPERFLR